jgi:hypothetical protein
MRIILWNANEDKYHQYKYEKYFLPFLSPSFISDKSQLSGNLDKSFLLIKYYMYGRTTLVINF